MELMAFVMLLSIIGELILFSVYGYLYITERKNHMKFWTLSWGVCTIHYFLEFLTITDKYSMLMPTAHILAGISGLLLFWGTQKFLDKQTSNKWLLILGLVVSWTLIAGLNDFSFVASSLPIYILISVFYIWTGLALLRSKKVKSIGSQVTGTTFILWGIHKLDYPFLRPLNRLAPWGYILSVVFMFIIAFGILFMYFAKTRWRLEKNEKKYRKLFHNADDAIFLNKLAPNEKPGKFVEVNKVACQKLNLSKEELLNMNPGDIQFKERAKDLKKFLQNIIKGEQSIFEVTLQFDNRENIFLEVNPHKFTLDGEDMLLSIARDITKRKKAEETIKHQALHDNLTNLPNRTLLKQNFKEIIKDNKDKELAILLLDLDHFKKINDTLGYDIGDQLFKAIAQRLNNFTNPQDTLVRMGSDEFGFLLTDANNKQRVIDKIKKIDNGFQKPFIVEDYELYMTLSIGVSMYPADGKKIKTLISNADAAIHYAKTKSENSYQFFDSDMSKPSLQHLQLANDLREAIEREEFVVYYHPQIDMQNNEFKGMEALIRWQHPSKGLLSPGKFIPLAEETGLIVKIDELVLRAACKYTRYLQKIGMNNLQISVNLSTRHFQRKDLPKTINKVLTETGLAPRHLEIEITESAAIQNMESTIQILKQLKDIGIQISLDDFGTGYSSLNYLKEMQIDNLKIDKSFISNLANNPDSQAITNTIIDMAQNLDLKVTAEGVETKEQFEFLKEQNCQYAQGYLFGKPAPPEEIEVTLRENNVSLQKEIIL